MQTRLTTMVSGMNMQQALAYQNPLMAQQSMIGFNPNASMIGMGMNPNMMGMQSMPQPALQ